MKILNKILLILLVISMLTASLVSCELLGLSSPDNGEDGTDKGNQGGNDTDPGEFVDYAAQVKFNSASGRAYIKATVKTFVDGDTTHFDVSDRKIAPTGVLKARYLAINTPESTIFCDDLYMSNIAFVWSN